MDGAALASLPPPLTPPHKGEGNTRVPVACAYDMVAAPSGPKLMVRT